MYIRVGPIFNCTTTLLSKQMKVLILAILIAILNSLTTPKLKQKQKLGIPGCCCPPRPCGCDGTTTITLYSTITEIGTVFLTSYVQTTVTSSTFITFTQSVPGPTISTTSSTTTTLISSTTTTATTSVTILTTTTSTSTVQVSTSTTQTLTFY